VNDASEAGLAVLNRQLAQIEALDADEHVETVTLLNDGSADLDTRLGDVAQKFSGPQTGPPVNQ
jgi:hypothetical protein